jgi:glycosyltransferase involved in cell wall biosynthesis
MSANAVPGRSPGAVLFVHASDEAYGADRVLLRVALAMRDRGRPVRVLVPDDAAPGWLSARLEESGITVVRGPLAIARRRYLRPRGLLAYAGALRRARAFIRAQSIDHGARLIHVNTSAVLAGAIIGRPRGARVVWHVHEIVVRPRAAAMLFRALPPLGADRVIAISHAVAAHLIAPGPLRRRIVTIWNGLPPREAPIAMRTTNGSPLVAFVGRLNQWKGAGVFVDAAAVVAGAHPTARFLIAGDAPEGEAWREEAMDHRIRATGLEDRIERIGRVEDATAVMDRAAIVVVPSTWPEPFGLVIAEAMQAGCAVVASAHGGATELVADGVSGLLVPPDDPEALAGAISRLLDDPATRRRLGEAGRARIAAHFSLAASVEAVDRLYRGIERAGPGS